MRVPSGDQGGEMIGSLCARMNSELKPSASATCSSKRCGNLVT